MGDVSFMGKSTFYGKLVLRALLKGTLVVLALMPLMGSSACQPYYGVTRVSVRLSRPADVPGDALVYVDDVLVGDLATVTKRGLSVEPGRHRVTVEKTGYFPWDRAIDATEQPVKLDVVLRQIPE